ncbi:thiamine phosphate synthase [Nannocystis bainbridge]|uniref:Thiamine phosphate synthase n=1 Tax=Nannocystis bainbridge TaxID=2995303 RepID=A0ABT5EBD0_9BACT|nr:thiamine phosphate synthase [Nannocystis bainbridge]MDC0722910.1 thiamine phosphate synthase [Nannocystis bainbridge]
MTPPFHLLAITPPTGPVDPELVGCWRAGAGDLALAVLLREPGAAPEALLDPAGRLAAVVRRCRERAIPILLAVDPEHALRAAGLPDVDGLHLRGDPSLVRLAELRPRLPGLLGRAVHGPPQPGHHLVDYTLVAPVFPPTTAQPGAPLGSKRPIGLDGLRAWAAEPAACLVALGGVGPATAAACLAAGARALAGIGVFFGPPARVEQDVAALSEQLRASHVVSPRTRA